MRRLYAAASVILLASCSAPVKHARVAARDEISAIQVIPTQMRTAGSAAPVDALAISGTITNDGRKALRCNALTFFVIDGQGNAVAPVSQYCAEIAIPPQHSGYFNATFGTTQIDDLSLRYEHPDGSYENHELVVPPR